MKRRVAWLHVGSLGAALVFVAPPAWAQTDAINNVVPATSTTLALATVVAAVPVLVTTSVIAAPDEGELEAYLRSNRVALAYDLSVGAGGSLDDLAAMYGVRAPARARFGLGLRARRAALLKGLGELDDGGAERFGVEVASWARQTMQGGRAESTPGH